MEAAQTDLVFSALAHAARRRMLDLLMQAPGMTVQALASHFDVSRIMVLKHVRILEQAELVISHKVGRERHLYFNAIPIQHIYDRWTTAYTSFWASKMVDLKSMIEQRASAKEHRRA